MGDGPDQNDIEGASTADADGGETSNRRDEPFDRRPTDVEGHASAEYPDHAEIEETPEPISPSDSPFDDTDEQSTEDVPPDELESIVEDSSRIPSIVILSGARAGDTTRLDRSERTLLGRHREKADIWFRDGGVSRLHAAVEVSDRGVLIRDLDSSNGTFVNGERIGDIRFLDQGDKIALGNRALLKYTVHDELDEKFQRKMYESSIRDELTDAYSRAYLEEQMRSEMAFADRHDTDVALLLFDIDDFKSINDTHGHVVGDEVLVGISEIVRGAIRTEDLLARFGGDEFAVLMRDIDREIVEDVAERVRSRVDSRKFEIHDEELSVSISVGGALYSSVMMRDVDDWFRTTDDALYNAKDAGRNCVRIRKSPLADNDDVRKTVT